MIEITKRSREFTEVEEYLMTIAPSIISMKDLEDGTPIEVAGTLEFIDTKEDTGEVVNILSIITPNNEVYSCQSATFKRSLADIKTIMKDKPFSIIKMSGKTKAGRDFINCTLRINK